MSVNQLRKLEEQISGTVRGELELKEEFEEGEGLQQHSEKAIEPNTDKNIVIEGLLLPKDEISRNNVLYDWDRVKEIYEQLIGKKMFYNHSDDSQMPPVGKFLDTWLVEDDSEKTDGWYYRAQVQRDNDYTEAILAGNLDKVSIQVIAGKAEEETNSDDEKYTRAYISTIKEASLVGVPGFTQTTLDVAIAEAFSEETGQTTNNNPGATTNKKPGDEEVDVTLGEDGDPCWDNYKMVGTKQQDGKTVPKCVPEEMADQFSEEEGDDRVVIEDSDEVVIEVEGEERGLIVESDGEKYHCKYWYDDVDEIAPVNVLVDGEKIDEAKTVTLGIHADSYEEESLEGKLQELQNHF